MLIFLNDKSEYNQLYRKSLMETVEEGGESVSSLGVLDSPRSLMKFLSLNFRRCQVVSSNLKSNLVALLAYTGSLTIIVNGQGRYRNRPTFRALFRFLLDLRSRKAQAVFQNYADYRFYRRYCQRARLHWVPGSGGVARATGKSSESYVVVQRDSKLALVAASLKESAQLISQLHTAEPASFTLVGCSPDNKIVQSQLPAFKSVGRYPQEQIFIDGKSFIQPEGYGEGVPHTLVDAICSEMQVVIKKGCFLRYGLHQLDCGFESIGKGWGRLEASDSTKQALALNTVNASYLQVIRSMGKSQK